VDDEFPIESIINQLQSLQEQFNSVSSDSTEKNSVTDSLISRKEKGEITREELNKLLIEHLRDKHDKMVQEQTDSDRRNSSFAEKVGDSVSSGISRIFKKVFSKSKIDLEDTKIRVKIHQQHHLQEHMIQVITLMHLRMKRLVVLNEQEKLSQSLNLLMLVLLI
jgi:hypothetical protein